MPTKARLWAALLALLVAALAGWGGLSDAWPLTLLFFLGIVGAFPMMLIEGPHGAGTHVENIIGGTVFVLVNAAFYYFLFYWIFRIVFRLRRSRNVNVIEGDC